MWICSSVSTCVEFDVAVSAPLVLEQTAAEGALEGQLVAVDLLVALQVAQAAEEMDGEQSLSKDHRGN